jgi:hypothetical protein
MNQYITRNFSEAFEKIAETSIGSRSDSAVYFNLVAGVVGGGSQSSGEAVGWSAFALVIAILPLPKGQQLEFLLLTVAIIETAECVTFEAFSPDDAAVLEASVAHLAHREDAVTFIRAAYDDVLRLLTAADETDQLHRDFTASALDKARRLKTGFKQWMISAGFAAARAAAWN